MGVDEEDLLEIIMENFPTRTYGITYILTGSSCSIKTRI